MAELVDENGESKEEVDGAGAGGFEKPKGRGPRRARSAMAMGGRNGGYITESSRS
jgi:hypothetical protein